MIPYTLPEEKETLLYYAELLESGIAKTVIEKNTISSREEAVAFANFYWAMVVKSNEEDAKIGLSSDYMLEKIIITLMAYYRSSGFEREWDYVSDQH
jgi:hypothetical protein